MNRDSNTQSTHWMQLHERLNTSVLYESEIPESFCIKYIYLNKHNPNIFVDTSSCLVPASTLLDIKKIIGDGKRPSSACIDVLLFNVGISGNDVRGMIDIPTKELGNALLESVFGKDTFKIVPSVNIFHHLNTLYVFYEQNCKKRTTKKVQFTSQSVTRKIKFEPVS